MKKIQFLIIVLLVSGFHCCYGCFTIVAGRGATQDSSVLVGHNEQNYDERNITSFRYIPAMFHKRGTMVQLRNGGSLSEAAATNGMLWLQNHGTVFGDSYFNEYGVAVVSNACPSRLKDPDTLKALGYIKDGGINYMLRRLVAQRAKSAREGVEIMANLLKKFGYTSSGRTYTIADKNEAWLVSVVMGGHFVAQRVPDTGVVMLPNIFIIGSVDFKDSVNFIFSDSIVEFSIKMGLFQYKRNDSVFNFAEVFNREPRKGSFKRRHKVDYRQWYAQQVILSREVNKPDDKTLPFAVFPVKKTTIQDMLKILRSHNEGTRYDDTKGYMLGCPHFMRDQARDICDGGTQACSIFQLRNWMPEEIGCLVWHCTTAPCTGVLTPWYAGISKTPECYYKPAEPEEALALDYQFGMPVKELRFNPDFAFDIFNELENLVSYDYPKALKDVRREWDALEQEQFAMQREVEEIALLMWGKSPKQSKKYITDRKSTRLNSSHYS